MKLIQFKFPGILILISVITVLSFSDCGQQEETKKTETTVGPANPEVKSPETIADSGAVIPVNPASSATPGVKTDLKKDIIPVDKMKIPEPVKTKEPVNNITTVQPAMADKKPAQVTITAPPENKTVVQPQPTPEVKVPEPTKPAPQPQPNVTEVPKPVTVVTQQPQQDGWIVPAKYKNMTSPFPVDKESIDLGKTLYGTHCKSCHGSKGEGNGPKATTIDTKIGSFLSTAFLTQKPGEVYYKSIFGKGDMPKFDKKIPDEEERWALVHYIINMKN